MKGLLPGIVLLLSACADIPPVEVGGPSGARLMNGQPRDAWEAYEMAYYDLPRQHRDIVRNIEPQRENRTGARVSIETIIRRLEMMQSLVTPESRAAFDPFFARYRAWHQDIVNWSWGGSFASDVERSEREVKLKFSPDKVTLAQEAAPSPAAAPRPSKPPATDVPDDKAVLPDQPPRTAPPPTPAAPAAAPPAATGGSARIYYKAWDRAHDDLVKSYKEKKACAANYKDVAESLRLLKEQLPADRANKLQIYVEYYASIESKTKGFTALPENTTEADILVELGVAATVLRKDFNPDK